MLNSFLSWLWAICLLLTAANRASEGDTWWTLADGVMAGSLLTIAVLLTFQAIAESVSKGK